MVADSNLNIAGMLEPGEQLLWSGQPHYRHFRSEAWAAFVFGFIPLIASLGSWLLLGFLVRDAIIGGRIYDLLGFPIVLLPAVGFGFVAFRALGAPWTVPRRLSRTRYAVTDRRVLVLHGSGYSWSDMVPTPHHERYDFTPEQARGRAVKRRRGGRVDVVLRVEEHRGGRGRRNWVDIGILGVEDWQDAVVAIDATFRVASDAEPSAAPARRGM